MHRDKLISNLQSDFVQQGCIVYLKAKLSRQRGAVVRSGVFTMTVILRCWFNSCRSFAITSVNNMLQVDFLSVVESEKQQIKEVKSQPLTKKLGNKSINESGFVLSISPPTLSRDRRIKMKKSDINLSALY